MNIISFLSAVNAPNDLWTIMINWVQSGVGNFGWAILLATIIVKLVTSPLDCLVKYNTKKQMLVQQKCAPQIAKLQKKFGNDQNSFKIQQNALYKREGLNVGVGCFVMLANLIITMVIFFTFYSSLRQVSAYQAINEYEQVEKAYYDSYYSELDSYLTTNNITLLANDKGEIETKEEFFNNYRKNYKTVQQLEGKEKLTDEQRAKLAKAQEYVDSYDALFANDTYSNFSDVDKVLAKEPSKEVVKKWNSIKSSWLWIDNIWLADATITPFPDYESLKGIASGGGNYYSKYVSDNINKDDYIKFSKLINDSSRADNGYYILAILAGLLTFLSQWISDLHNKLKNKKANMLAKDANAAGTSMKFMKIIMPIIMVIFVITTGASFGIYLLASNLAALAFGEIISLIVDALTKKKRLEVEAELEKEANRLIKKGKLQG